MKLTKKQAELLTSREKQMVESKGPWEVKTLVSLIKRTREARDKYRQLEHRQAKAASRRASGSMAAGNARTAQKAELFDRALAGFESALHSLNSESTAAARELKVNARSTARAASAAPTGRSRGTAS
jgi:hypothetical protein